MVGQDSSAFGFIEDCVDMGALLRIEAIILPIIFWSLFYSLNKKRNTGTKAKSIVEVLSITDPRNVNRHDAKLNLHTIREQNARFKIDKVFFDRFWYENREMEQRRLRISKRR